MSIKAFEKIKLMYAQADTIQKKIAEAYMKGVNNTSKDLLVQITEMKNQVKKNIEKNIEDEKALKDEYRKKEINLKKENDDILQEKDKRHKDQCEKCQQTTDAEREYLRKLQNVLTAQLKKLDYMFSRVEQYLETVKDAHDTIMYNAGRVTSVDHMIVSLKKDFKELATFSTPLLDSRK
jgi:hypothetical protein